MSTGEDGGADSPFSATGSNPAVAATENTLLLYPDSSSAARSSWSRRQSAREAEAGLRHEDDEEGGEGLEGEEIDPNEFDILLSKSVPTSGGFLEPAVTETPMLRGPRRRRLSSISARRRSSTSLIPGHRPSILRPTTEGDESPSSSSTSISRRLSRELSEGTIYSGSTAREGAQVDERYPLLAPCDSGSSFALAETTPESPYLIDISHSRFWLIFTDILLSFFISCFDSTIMASSHPVITSYFNASNSAAWLSTAFLLTSTAFQPLLGRISDSLGRKPPYMFTKVIFAVSTLWCACAGSMTSFILARAVCGIGAGGMMTLGGIIMSDIVPIEQRGAYQGYMNIIYGAGSALGAALGGAMADHLGWRWEFGVQVIPLILLCFIAHVAIPDDLGLETKKESFMEAMKTFDIRGSVLLTVSITFFILGLNLGGNVLPWSHPFVIASLVIFAVCFPSFLHSQSLAERPIMPLYLITQAPRANLIFGNFIASILSNAVLFNIPLFFQAVLLTSPTTSGLNLVLPTLVSSVAGTATGFLMAYTRRLKWPSMSGATLIFIGTTILSFLRRGWPDPLYLLVLCPSSIGQGFQFPGTFMAVLATSEQREQAVVTSTLIAWRGLGNILGVAASSLVVQNALTVYLQRFVQGPLRDEVIELVRESVEAVARLEQPYRDQVVMSYESALRITFTCCAVLAFISVCLLLPIRLPRLGQRQ
ncbi:MFS general substrate transporter [Sodiomyces alkalinus F11]|uniref:MFS general substrate transporter n=1 Tax=Sodiomyces alkalinus (strain CBS 110278 / VKM F-3762 / F11) TaxID=1314773 RepID=A0A3N2Q4W4_SODAK|nr:MFS general substrate transporter [Sodiomyces alkalinus F11]ROT41809.1 MFS general substrate transporter [Sodiomyces alkalinus F11]